MSKLKLWNQHSCWEEAESVWDAKAQEAQKTHPLKTLKTLPQMPGITLETAKHLKWKSFKWMLQKDTTGFIVKNILRHPFRYAIRFLKSIFRKKSFVRDRDFFFYGIRNEEEMRQLMQDPSALLILGFSYCEKPFECPSGRFTPECRHDLDHDVCRQCFIGKIIHTLPEERCIPLLIPTIHYIGEKVFETVHKYPNKRILFIITACEMTLEMFGDWGNMAGIQGIGVRLDGRICNTMKAFELSENGVKPGLTVLLGDTQKRLLDLLKYWRCAVSDKSKLHTKA